MNADDEAKLKILLENNTRNEREDRVSRLSILEANYTNLSQKIDTFMGDTKSSFNTIFSKLDSMCDPSTGIFSELSKKITDNSKDIEAIKTDQENKKENGVNKKNNRWILIASIIAALLPGAIALFLRIIKG